MKNFKSFSQTTTINLDDLNYLIVSDGNYGKTHIIEAIEFIIYLSILEVDDIPENITKTNSFVEITIQTSSLNTASNELPESYKIKRYCHAEVCNTIMINGCEMPLDEYVEKYSFSYYLDRKVNFTIYT